ncbi:hypothetical protein NY055_06360 [Corynebacterium diphtheriae bv. mitis]|nr:hypothetical protein NY055_06360 [Corynebacterium diphtheriae bv. mitis]
MYLPGLPALRHEFGISQFDAQLTDYRRPWPARAIFFIGTIVLAIATLLSALAPHAWVLYLSRAAMGWSGISQSILHPHGLEQRRTSPCGNRSDHHGESHHRSQPPP